MQCLFVRQWDLISATLANAPVLYPMKVVSDDRTTMIALVTTVSTSLLHSLLSEVGSKTLSRTLSVANNLATVALSTRIYQKAVHKDPRATVCYASVQFFVSTMAFFVYMSNKDIVVSYTHRMISYALLGLYLSSHDVC